MRSYSRLLTVLTAIVWGVACARGRRTVLQNWKEQFPPYGCQTEPSLSPFQLEPRYSSSPSANGMRVCFTVAPLQDCPPSNPCCSKADFYKLELRVRPTCNHAIRSVTVNGKHAVMPTFETYGAARDKALFKMPQLNLTRSNATGVQICISLHDPCPNMRALCPEGDGSCTYAISQSGRSKCCPVNRLGSSLLPPPPSPAPPPPATPTKPSARQPPSPPAAFPFCKCNTTTGLLPFTLAGAPSVSRTSSGNNLYCFALARGACADPDSPCCSSDLFKVEWWSYDTCRGSVRAAFIDKIQYPVTWDRDGTFRLTKLNWSARDVAAHPKQLCVELRNDSPCNTVEKFCRGGGCTYALFDTTKRCCPTSSTPETR